MNLLISPKQFFASLEIMNTNKNPFIVDLIASILSFAIIILSNILPRGENTYFKIGSLLLLPYSLSHFFIYIQFKKRRNYETDLGMLLKNIV